MGNSTNPLLWVDLINVLSAFGIGTIIVLVSRLFGTVKSFYDIKEDLIEKRVAIETANLSSKIDVLDAMLLQREERISGLTKFIEVNQIKNNVILKDFIDIGVNKLDPNQKMELEKIIREQEELRILA